MTKFFWRFWMLPLPTFLQNFKVFCWSRVRLLHENDVLKTESVFLCVFCFFCVNNIVKMVPVHTKNPALFMSVQYMVISQRNIIDWTCMHVHDMSIFVVHFTLWNPFSYSRFAFLRAPKHCCRVNEQAKCVKSFIFSV